AAGRAARPLGRQRPAEPRRQHAADDRGRRRRVAPDREQQHRRRPRAEPPRGDHDRPDHRLRSLQRRSFVGAAEAAIAAPAAPTLVSGPIWYDYAFSKDREHALNGDGDRAGDRPGTASDALVFFGATGDLAHKKIYPALQALSRAGALDMPVIGVARAGWDTDTLRE